MKIDRTKSKKSSSDVPFDCKLLIEKLKSCNEEELLSTLKKIKTWGCGKCELYHWIDVLDIFDSILEECCKKNDENQWSLPVDQPENEKKKELLLAVISFTSILIEHSFSRHLYNSIEHLITLLSSTDMQIVLAILNLLFVFSKRSNFFSRISSEKRQSLLSRLLYLADNWGGKDNYFGLAQCCQDLPLSSYPSSSTSFNFEFYSNDKGDKENLKKPNTIVRIYIEDVHASDKSVSQLMEELVSKYEIPKKFHIRIFNQLRLTKNFANYQKRLQCVQARLSALSIIVYCQAMSVQDTYFQLLYSGLVEELVEVLELNAPDLIEIKSAALKALTSIIHLNRNSKMKSIIDATGASSYHGFLPILVRNSINSFISGETEQFPLNFATALFSFLYHLASYESGCEALVQCGIMESLLKVIDWKGSELDHITFVTRAVRVIDLLTNQFVDMNSFQTNNGLNIFVQRLEYEVDICRKEQPHEIIVPADKLNKDKTISLSSEKIDDSVTPMEVENDSQASTSQIQQSKEPIIDKSLFSSNDFQCYPQRAALMKSMLNFLKKAVQCSALSEGVRHLMYGNFPRSLRHIISNAEYYGSSLFLLATDVVSVYVYQEPSLLSTIQDNGLTDVILYAILVKEVPPTKEVLASLPNVFTSLCLNHRGLEAFVKLKPFDRLFKIFISPEYLQAMRRRRSESIGDTASTLGNSIDELIRHQPSLRSEAIASIIKLLEEICRLGTDSKYICTKISTKSSDSSIGMVLSVNSNRAIPSNSNINNDLSSEEDEEDYDDDTATTTTPPSNVISDNALILPSTSEDNTVVMKPNNNRTEASREQIPLIEYILNVMRFLDAILSNNSTDDHCQEFLNQNGLVPLFKLMQLPNLPLDFPLLPACFSISTVFKTILNLAHEKDIFINGLEKLEEIFVKLDPLINSMKSFNGSVLLEDLIVHLNSKKNINQIQPNLITPLLQAMASTHSFIVMFMHICRTGQGDIRQISIELWGSKLGIEIINQLSNLYISLVWESTLLLGLNDTNLLKYEFVKLQLEKLNSLLKNNVENENVSSPMEVDVDTDSICSSCGNKPETDTKKCKTTSKNTHQKYIKPLLTVASRLGRSLAELFGLFVKLSVGSPIRRRNHHYNLQNPIPNTPLIPSKSCQNISKNLNILLSKGLSWQPPFDTNIPKYRLTFYVCSIGFSSPMLFDDRNFPYHTMLQNFVIHGGQDAFFECFKMAFNQSNLGENDLPDGVTEFLDSWLLLLEKLINPQTLMESPHCLSSRMKPTHHSRADYNLFDPIQYLIRTHRKAFPCIMELWNNKLFKINCDRVIDSLLTIFSHLLKGEKLIETNLVKNEISTTAAITPTEVSVSRTSLPEVSTMYPELLNILVDMGFPRETAAYALVQTENDVEQAAEFLLSNSSVRPNVSAEFEMTEENGGSSSTLNNSDTGFTEKSSDNKQNEPVPELEPLKNEVLLNKSEINSFTNNILCGTLKLLDNHPDMVYKCCELLIAVAKRNGNAWFEEMISNLIKDIIINCDNLLISTSYMREKQQLPIKEFADQLSTLPEASKLSSCIHLLALLFKEMKNLCVKQICNSMLITKLIELLEQSSYLFKLVFENDSNIITPKWLATAVLLIDVYAKHTLLSRLRLELLTNYPKRQWKYFDDRSSRWTSYIAAHNKAINDAFQQMEPHYRFKVERRRYIIHFNNMVQVNEDSSSWRPIMFVNDTSQKEEQICPTDYFIGEPLNNNQSKLLIEVMVSLVKLPIDSDTLHAVLRLCLRLTRDYSKACLFAEIGGVSALLNLSNASKFAGIVSLSTLIIRHAIEDENILNTTMEKIIRHQANSPITNNREVHNIFRYFHPLPCRNMNLFKSLSKSILRFNVYSRRLDSEDERTSTYLRAVNVKSGDSENSIEIPKIAKEIITELLNMLPLKYTQESQANENDLNDKKLQEGCKNIFNVNSILSLLAELIRSYNVLAKVICEHYYTRGYVDLIVEDCSAISFILDNMLFSTKKISDKENTCSSLSILLLTSVGSVSFSSEVHQTLILEIKYSLSRAVLLPESFEKHTKIQYLSALIMNIVESYPQQSLTQNLFGRHHISVNSNPLIKLLLKKGILCDLAKIIQSLDLSSPFMATTVNSILKTLEYLSKTVNSPQNICTKNSRSNRNETSAPNAVSVSNQEVMDEDNSQNNSNNLTSQLNSLATSINQVMSQTTNAINDDINASSLSNTLDNSNVDENTENELFGLDSVAFDFNTHPRSGTFTSDELRTDDDDDDVMHDTVIVSEDLSDNRNEHRDNTVNSNCAESTSSDETQSDVDDDDSDDEEVEEEEDDVVGSAQDGHEDDDEDDDDDQMEDEEDEEVAEDYIQSIIDDSLSYPGNNVIFNLEQVLPHVLQIRDRVPNYISLMNEDSNVSNDIPTSQPVISSSNIVVQHPLLSNNTNVTANVSQFNPVNVAATRHLFINGHPRGTARSETIRSSFVPHINHRSFHFANFTSRSNSTLLQRLLGTNSSSDILGSMTIRSTPGLSVGNIEFHDELNELNLSNGLGSSFSSLSQDASSTVSRWYEECRVLDDEFMFDPIFLVKPEIIKCLEQYKEEEIKEKKKKKEEDMEVNADLKSKVKKPEESTEPQTVQQNEAQIDDLHARIESIANSVINQVLDPPVPMLDAQQNEQNEASSVSLNPSENLLNRNVHRMEIVNEEQPEIAMTTDTNSTDTSAIESSNAVIIEERVSEVMDQSNDNPEQSTNAGDANQQSITSYNLTAEEMAILGDLEIPEGVDPSFLAALPENIRQEVISEQFRLQRLNNIQQQPAVTNTTNNPSNTASFAEVNPEFLAALPPNIQEEVLAQQRAEQQRLSSQNTNPDTPVDPDSFFRSLPTTLRRQVLSDLDDSQLRLLPPDIAGEARALRQEYEIRHRQFQERLISSSNALSRIIQSAATARARFDSINPLHNHQWSLRINTGNSHSNRNALTDLRYNKNLMNRSIKGKFLLDYDALSSLLILIFIRDNTINAVRLYRLIKNLCYHTHTRQWIIQSLLEILEKTKESLDSKEYHNPYATDSTTNDDMPIKFSVQNPSVSWLSISLEAAFGSKTNVFSINKNQSVGSKKPTYSISINHQASSFVCRNVLEILISLAKSFPEQFISYSNTNLSKNLSCSSLNTSLSGSKESQDYPSSLYSLKNSPNFFDVLLRHDSIYMNKKTKSSKHVASSSNLSFVDHDSHKSVDSPFSQLLNLLSHQFIKKSPILIDRLVRLLTHVTYAMNSTDNLENKSTPTNENAESKEKYAEIEKAVANEKLLKLVVDVLILKSCSEEGLVDATSLLIKLSTIFSNCRNIFYKLLLDGVRLLGEKVFCDISALDCELKDFLSKLKQESSQSDSCTEHFDKNNLQKGYIPDRFSNIPIVINASSSAKHSISGKEVQLSSMSTLISKSSNQFLFLRILKIIMHIREISNRKNKTPSGSNDSKMEIDNEDKLSSELQLEHLWDKLSECLCLLSEAPDDHAVLVLQPAVEAFFLVHAPEKSNKVDLRTEPVTLQLAHIHQNISSINEPLTNEQHTDSDNRQYNNLPLDTQKFLVFAEKHRVVLNQILRQSNVHLANGPFAVLVDHTRILDFDVKRRYFRQELDRLDQNVRRDDLPVHIRREHIFEDSYRELNRRTPEEWKNRFYVVFEGEEGQDAGGLLREWYSIISREIFNPNYVLFTTSPGDRVTYMINSASHCNSNHLSYFKFVGRVIAKAIFDNKLLDCYFTRSFYKHILGKLVKYTDMESEDYSFYQGLVFLLEHNVNELGTELTFSLEVQEFGVTEIRDLVLNGRNIIVTEENKLEYVTLVCQEKMTGSIRQQLNSFLEGFYEIIPKRLISIFNEHELELLISGLPTIDIDDLKINTEYHKYQASSLQIQWFWRALRTFDQADRAKFLQFVTGTSKVPLQGFSALEGMNGPQKFQIHLDDRSTDRLPSAHTCFNQLDLPAYETYDKLRLMLLKAIHECSEGFGFA